MKKVFLKPKKEAPVRRFHPWVFSGAVHRTEGTPMDGDVVEVRSHRGDLLGIGHYQEGSIRVRIFSFEATSADQSFWSRKLSLALAYRKQIGLTEDPSTNCYRLVNGSGDGLPGLIIDVYDKTAVLQCHSIGMHRAKEFLTHALTGLYGNQLEAVYDKSKETLPTTYAGNVPNQYLYGKSPGEIVRENDHSFIVNWETGQKTGFFLDQRENRQLLTKYAAGKTILDAFCYSGGFSVYALSAGAKSVDSVDISAKAIELTERNVALNGVDSPRHKGYAGDVLNFLRQSDKKYDVIVVDPPAFAKSLKKRHNAVQGYKRLNSMAIQCLRPGGIIFTFSCSQVVDKKLFFHTIVAAALDADRKARVMHQLDHAPDHPIHLFHPEGEYLKGLVLFVD
jgi:23S rRNA (cytosine1962-C5)-methyltransferase